MAKTVIGFGDPKAAKKWAALLAVDQNKKSYFTKKFVGKGDNFVIQQKTELESDAGESILFDLSVQLRGKPVYGDNVADGTEEALRFFTDEVNIDQVRHPVSAGGRMTRKRTVHDLRKTAKDRLSDYFSAWTDEVQFIYLSGARGINEDFIEDESYAGFANNAIQAPDSQHLIYGGSATSKATIVATDVMDVSLIEKTCVSATMMRAQDPEAANMRPVQIEGENHYVLVMCPFQEHDLRTGSGTGGWLDIQKAAASAEGKSNAIFKGGLGMINNVVLHSHERAIRFDDYGAGTNLDAARALFMGRQAGVVAYGTPKGSRFDWVEETKDSGNQHNVTAGCIMGCKKTRFNGRDFGVIALDTYAKNPLN